MPLKQRVYYEMFQFTETKLQENINLIMSHLVKRVRVNHALYMLQRFLGTLKDHPACQWIQKAKTKCWTLPYKFGNTRNQRHKQNGLPQRKSSLRVVEVLSGIQAASSTNQNDLIFQCVCIGSLLCDSIILGTGNTEVKKTKILSSQNLYLMRERNNKEIQIQQ